jgi:hypothetical protein
MWKVSKMTKPQQVAGIDLPQSGGGAAGMLGSMGTTMAGEQFKIIIWNRLQNTHYMYKMHNLPQDALVSPWLDVS